PATSSARVSTAVVVLAIIAVLLKRKKLRRSDVAEQGRKRRGYCSNPTEKTNRGGARVWIPAPTPVVGRLRVKRSFAHPRHDGWGLGIDLNAAVEGRLAVGAGRVHQPVARGQRHVEAAGRVGRHALLHGLLGGADKPHRGVGPRGVVVAHQFPLDL